MNIIDLQERLKDLPENALMQEMQAPTGTAPQFLVLSELKRRKRMRDEYQRQEAQGMQTVAEEAITAAGMPQEGIMGLAQGMAPRSAIAQDTGVNDMMQQDSVRAPQPEQPMMMAGGGIVRRMQDGGFSDRQQQGYLIFLEQMSLQDSPQSREMYTRMMERQAASPPAPEFYMRGMDEAPQGIASISADVSSFLPGGPDDETRAMPRADSRPTMMTAPPVLGAAPTADGIDFDASVFETAPAAEPETDEAYLGPPQSVSDAVRALEEYYPGSGYGDVMLGGPRMPPPAARPDVEVVSGSHPIADAMADAVRRRNELLADPNLSQAQRDILEAQEATAEKILEVLNAGVSGVNAVGDFAQDIGNAGRRALGYGVGMLDLDLGAQLLEQGREEPIDILTPLLLADPDAAAPLRIKIFPLVLTAWISPAAELRCHLMM
jgi:hypothetical protein